MVVVTIDMYMSTRMVSCFALVCVTVTMSWDDICQC